MDLKLFIESFADSRQLTMQALASALGYRSALTIERMLAGRAGRESARRFGQRVQQAFRLSEDEKLALDQAVQTALPSSAEDHSEMEMWAFLQGRPVDPFGNRSVEVECAGSGSRKSLYDWYARATDIRITLLNCQYSPIFAQLRQLLKRKNARISHYITINNDIARTAHTVNALMPIFYEKGYLGYSHHETAQDKARGVSVADMLVCSYLDEHGAPKEDMIIFDQAAGAKKWTREGGGDAFLRMLGLSQTQYRSFKRTDFGGGEADGYVKYSMEYANLEFNRAIYKIKPDIGVDYIYGSILASAVREGPMPKDEYTEHMICKLERIYAERVRNSFSKRKSAHTILKQSAMRRFAKTGKTSDHFWGMRPFTPAERARILTVLLNQQTKNPYFNLYFMRDEAAIRDVDLALYEGEGILMLNANTNYDLSGGHSEVMFTHTEFMRLYKDFFMHHLIKHQVLPEADTLRILDELIAECH